MEQNDLQNRNVIRLFTKNNIILLVGFAFVTIVSFLFALTKVGAMSLSLSDIFNIVLNRELHITQYQILTEIRLPFAMNTLLYGAAMGVAGVLLQRVTRSQGACPSTLGLVPGSILAIGIVVHLFELQNEWMALFIGILGSVFGLLMAYALSFVIPIKDKGMRRLVGGLADTGVLGVMLFIFYIKWAQELSVLVLFQNGLFRTGSLLLPICLVCFFFSLCLSGRMNRSSNGDSMWLVLICIVLAIVLTGTAVTTLGSWVMVGLMASTVARWLVKREDYRIILPVAGMIGGIIMTVISIASNILNPALDSPLQNVTGLIGLPLLAFLIWKEAIRYAAASHAGKAI